MDGEEEFAEFQDGLGDEEDDVLPPENDQELEEEIEGLEGCDYVRCSPPGDGLADAAGDTQYRQDLARLEEQYPGILSKSQCPLCNSNFSDHAEFTTLVNGIVGTINLDRTHDTKFAQISTLHRVHIQSRNQMSGTDVIPWTPSLVKHHYTTHVTTPALAREEILTKSMQLWRVVFQQCLNRAGTFTTGDDPRLHSMDISLMREWGALTRSIEGMLKSVGASGSAASLTGAGRNGLKVLKGGGY